MTKKLPKPKKTGPKKASTEPDDEALWGHVAAGVAPLGRRHKNRTPEVETSPLSARATKNQAPKRKVVFHTADSGMKMPRGRSTLPELRHGNQPGVDKNTAKRLKKGQHRIEGRMDLHGSP